MAPATGSSERLRELFEQLDTGAATGSLRLAGPETTGTLFFDSGRIYFAVIEGRALTPAELRAAGIDHVMWQQAGSRPGAKGRFAEELMALGCPRDAIERFVFSRVTALLDLLTDAAHVEATSGSGRHGFGTAISIPAGRFFEPTAGFPEEMLVSLSRCHGSEVTLDASIWNGIASLFAPMRFAELAESLGASAASALVHSLETRGLVDLVDGSAPTGDGADVDVEAEAETGEVVPDTSSPGGLFDRPEDDEYEEYVPERVGRQAYAAIASMRASAAEAPPQEKAHALRRLIEAVRGL
jgi:hypothetical protein